MTMRAAPNKKMTLKLVFDGTIYAALFTMFRKSPAHSIDVESPLGIGGIGTNTGELLG